MGIPWVDHPHPVQFVAKASVGFMRNGEPYIGVYHTADMPEFFTDIDYIGMDALSRSPLLRACC